MKNDNTHIEHHVEHSGHVQHRVHGRGAEGRKRTSPAEDAKDVPKPKQVNPCGYDQSWGTKSHAQPQTYVKEHQMIPSHLGGKPREVSFGPLPGGLVPSNPFASLAQAGFLHAHPEKLGEKKLAEFDSATKGMKLPKHAKAK